MMFGSDISLLPYEICTIVFFAAHAELSAPSVVSL